MYCTADDIKKLGTILGVWAHPDDESWCMAGIMSVARSNGQRVVCITATKGDAGQTADETKWPQTRLGEIRQHELEHALEVLGVKEHHWLDYQDGKLAVSDGAAAIQQIAEIIEQVQPDSVFSFGPDGITGHPDHQTIHNWAKLAIKKAASKAKFYGAIEVKEKYEAIPQACHDAFNIYFNVDIPKTVPENKVDFFFVLPDSILSKKIESLEVQECQTAGIFAHPLGPNFIRDTAASEAFMEELV
jgi:LmbE family N-acetylglucosaminyl deacetylase